MTATKRQRTRKNSCAALRARSSCSRRQPGSTKLPSAEKLKAELNELTARKTALQAELRKIQREEKEFNLIQKNIGIILNAQKQKEKSEPELF